MISEGRGGWGGWGVVVSKKYLQFFFIFKKTILSHFISRFMLYPNLNFFFVRKTILSHFMFSSCFMLFPTFFGNTIFWGGGGGLSNKIVVLASEPVGGRSRSTELPCYIIVTNVYAYIFTIMLLLLYHIFHK